MEPTSIRLPGADGNMIHALEWSREGTPLILVHGFGNNARIWDEFAPLAAPHYRVVAIDLRGHGDSDHDPERRYQWDDHVRDLEAVTAALEIDRMVLVGHSLGGRTCLLFAGRNQARMAGLVVVDTGPEHDPRGQIRIRQEVEGRTSDGGDGSLASVKEYEQILAHNYPAGAPASIKRMAESELKQREDGRWVRKADPAFMSSMATASADEQAAYEEETRTKLWHACETVPCPTLVVRGAASDILSADTADKMVDDVLQNGTLAVVAQAAHSVMTDNPEGFNEAVSEFVLG
jgi:pimeloyl-ACP methyl ester carboxylesterase